MERDNPALEVATMLLAPWTRRLEAPEPHRLDAVLDPADLIPAVRALAAARWGYLSAITGLDCGAEVVATGGPGKPGPGDQPGRGPHIEVLYHFCAGAAVVTVRVRTPREAPSVPSVCAVIPSAGFFERELAEMFGVAVTDTPDPRRLFLPDDWPEGVYPLRKDFATGAPGAAPPTERGHGDERKR